jgi:cysteine-rich repeat protein
MRSATLAAGMVLALAGATRAAAPPFPGVTTRTFTSADGALPVLAESSLELLLPVAGMPGTIVDVDVTIDLVHPEPGRLVLSLVAPSGATVQLSNQNGGDNADVFAGTTFDDQATGTPSAPSVRNFEYTAGVATGTIQPEQALGALLGQAAEGPWVLVIDTSNTGEDGVLRSWSLVVSTVTTGGLHPGAPALFTGPGVTIPNDDDPAIASSPVSVSGLGQYLYDVDVTVDVAHPDAGALDLFLTGPGGRRIDLVTGVGDGQENLYAGTVFDDQSGMPIGSVELPPSGTPLARVVGEGALSAFVGTSPNGTWTLTVVDHAPFSRDEATLNWTLALTPTAACGDGVVDPGEECDDGNVTSGDGCDGNCTTTRCGNGLADPSEDCDDGARNGTPGACPATCHFPEAACDDCTDDDGDGRVDALDPGCGAAPLTIRHARVTGLGTSRARLVAKGVAHVGRKPSGTAEVVIGGAQGAIGCANLGPLRGLAARGRAAGGAVSVAIGSGGRVVVTGHDLDLRAAGDGHLDFGVRVGSTQLAGGGTFRKRGRSTWVFP